MRVLGLLGVIAIAPMALLGASDGIKDHISNYGIYYHADMGIYPGMGFYVQKNVSVSDKNRGKRNVAVIRVASFRPSMRFYVHPRVNTVINPGLIFNYSFGRANGLYADLDLGLGYWLQVNNGATYSLEDGQISQGASARSYMSIESSFGFGWRFKSQSAVFAKAGIFQQAPYTTAGTLPRFLLQLGFSKQLAS